jgi:type 1 glutamine amidotransferase
MNRREMIRHTAAATLGLGLAGCTWPAGAAQPKTKKVLFFSKSSGYEHSVIKRKGDELSFAEKILADLGPKRGIEFTFSKDGSLFAPDYLKQFDAYFFYTTGDLTWAGTDKNPPMSPAGKAAFLDAIKKGKGFIGTHSATDTFHTNEPSGKEDRPARYHSYSPQIDPYLQMIGGEFIVHGKQQKSKMRVADLKFPGMPREDFEWVEEWYSLKEFAKDLHVLLVQETNGMEGAPYHRQPYPATWARMHGRGRVFYTSLGHRDDVWTNPVFQELLFGGIAWAVRTVDADIKPNLEKVTPHHAELPPTA